MPTTSFNNFKEPAGGGGTLLTDLISYWAMDETNGTRVDSHGTNDLTDFNSVGYNLGHVYTDAAEFSSAASQYLSINDNASISLGDIDFTYAIWIYPTATGVNTFWISNGSGNTNTVAFRIYQSTNNKVGATIGTGATGGFVASTSAITNSAWSLVLFWHDSVANTINIRINNGSVNSTSYSSGSHDSSQELRFARAGGAATSYFDGIMGPVSFWKKVLSSTEQDDIWNSGNGLDYASY